MTGSPLVEQFALTFNAAGSTPGAAILFGTSAVTT
jgi:hypothetical protein